MCIFKKIVCKVYHISNDKLIYDLIINLKLILGLNLKKLGI